MSTVTGKAARRVVSTAPSACGWLRGTSRTSPGPPRRWQRPVRLRGTSARGRGFAAYLPGCARQLLIVRCAHYAGGASLTTFGFVTTVPRYLPEARNSLTFVRGADRACCAPRKRYCGLICALRKWLYRPPRCLARAGTLACAPGSGTFAAAPGSGTLPPLCIIERREERGCRVAPLPRGGQGGGEEPPALRRRGSGSDSSKKRSQTESGRCPAGPRPPGLIGSTTV